MAERQDDLTLGEIARSFRDFKTDLREEITALRVAVENLNFVRPDLFHAVQENVELRIGHVEERMKRQEDQSSWMARTIAVALLGIVANIVVFVLTRT